ncbi:response regulator [Lederbergia citrea]|uniref:response regulator n=1 Tax=Lederbergia citrea TaxID=2833581 RepID=UPI001BC9DCB4|nr:response regulator [Lederbergia citrea]MBS4205538.1 response regulator [Lederbergia citrea]
MTALLIVDDESWVRDTIKALVTHETSPISHVDIEEAKNGIEALELIKIKQVDMIVTDMKMPGIDGKELLEIIEQKYPQLPVIVLSGYHDFIYTKQAIKSKVIEYLLKPVNEAELFQAIEKAIQFKKELEQQQMNYPLLSIHRPEISKIIQPLLRGFYFDFKESNINQFLNRIHKFSTSIDKPLKMDESFVFHLQQKFLIMIEEIIRDHQLRLEDLEIDLKIFNLYPTASFGQIIKNQIEIGQAIISAIERNKSQKTRINLEDIKQYIDQNFDIPDMSLDIVAKTFFVSKEYLTTVYKKKYGYNITEYIISLRMERAKQLVKNTTMQYKTIAEKVGYEDAPYFYRVFKKYFNISPGEMRKS